MTYLLSTQEWLKQWYEQRLTSSSTTSPYDNDNNRGHYFNANIAYRQDWRYGLRETPQRHTQRTQSA